MFRMTRALFQKHSQQNRTLLALMRPPSPLLNNGLTTHMEKSPLNYGLALKQWTHYCGVLVEHGVEVRPIPPPTQANDCPDSVFLEDPLFMYKGTAILTSPGAVERQPELQNIENTLLEHVNDRVSKVERIDNSNGATLEGGDILKIGDMLYVGQSGRTNDAGIAELARLVEPLGATVLPIPITEVLHLKSAFTALPCGTIIYWPDALTPSQLELISTHNQGKVVASLEESGSHVVVLDRHTLLISKYATKTIEMLNALPYNYTCIEVDISEYEKLEGCVTCLSVRIR